jgi:hypothetical protein
MAAYRRSAPHGDARGAEADEWALVTPRGVAKNGLASRTHAGSDARATLHGLPFPACHTPGYGEFSAPFFCLLFFGKDAPKEVPLGDKEKEVPPRTGATLIDRHENKERPRTEENRPQREQTDEIKKNQKKFTAAIQPPPSFVQSPLPAAQETPTLDAHRSI